MSVAGYGLLVENKDDPTDNSQPATDNLQLPHVHSAVYVQRVAGDEAGILGGGNATAAAMSWAVPTRASGICEVMAVRCSSVSTAVIAVSIKPGATAFTVIVRLASSRASDQ